MTVCPFALYTLYVQTMLLKSNKMDRAGVIASSNVWWAMCILLTTKKLVTVGFNMDNRQVVQVKKYYQLSSTVLPI